MTLLRCLHQALRAILRHPVATLVGIPLLFAIAAAGSVAPWVGVFFLLLAAPQLLGAVPAIALAAIDAKPAERVDWKLLVHGFRHYERWLGLFGVAYLVTVALAIPTILAFWLRLRILPESAGDPVLGAGIVVSAVLWLGVFHRYVFAPFVAVGLPRDEPMQRVLDQAEELLRGGRRELLPPAAVLVLICASGTLTPHSVGLVVTLPVGVFGLASLYRRVSS